MNRLFEFTLLCVLAPWLLARCHFLFGPLTRWLVYLLSAAQVLAVPVLVALDPDISFGSDTYSLGAGIGMILIGTVELAFLVGTVIGLFAATTFLRRKEAQQQIARTQAILNQLKP